MGMRLLGFHREDARLTYNIFKMNIRDRYLGSTLGLTWAVVNPLLLLGMYVFVFGFVIPAKIPGADTTLAYSIWLISGYVPYLAISDSLSCTASSVIAGSGLVKNIVFKSETLPLAATMAAAVPFAVGSTFLFILLIIDGNYPSVHAIALIPVILIQFLFLASVGLFLSATTVFIRDIVQILPTFLLLIIFFTPVFYTLEMMPDIIQDLTFFNPFYHIMQPYREILVYHRFPDWGGVAYLGGLSVTMFVAGLYYFRRLKGYFEMGL